MPFIPKSETMPKLQFLQVNQKGLTYNYPIIFKNEKAINAILPGMNIADKKQVRKNFRGILNKISTQYAETMPSKPQAKELAELIALFGFNQDSLTGKLDAKLLTAIFA